MNMFDEANKDESKIYFIFQGDSTNRDAWFHAKRWQARLNPDALFEVGYGNTPEEAVQSLSLKLSS